MKTKNILFVLLFSVFTITSCKQKPTETLSDEDVKVAIGWVMEDVKSTSDEIVAEFDTTQTKYLILYYIKMENYADEQIANCNNEIRKINLKYELDEPLSDGDYKLYQYNQVDIKKFEELKVQYNKAISQIKPKQKK